MILLVPVLEFRSFGNTRCPPIVKMLATQIQSTRAVSITPTTTLSIFLPEPRPPSVSLVLSLTSALPAPHAAVLLSAAGPAHRRRRCGRALAVNSVVRRLGP